MGFVAQPLAATAPLRGRRLISQHLPSGPDHVRQRFRGDHSFADL
jgi:hypothetical protein